MDGFNGYHVFFLSNDTRREEEQKFPTVESVLDRGFDEGFPDAEDFAENLFQIFGDIVEKVLDNDGNLLWDNAVAYKDNKDSLFWD